MRFASPPVRILLFLRLRFRLVVLLVRMWLVNAELALILPVPVF